MFNNLLLQIQAVTEPAPQEVNHTGTLIFSAMVIAGILYFWFQFKAGYEAGKVEQAKKRLKKGKKTTKKGTFTPAESLKLAALVSAGVNINDFSYDQLKTLCNR